MHVPCTRSAGPSAAPKFAREFPSCDREFRATHNVGREHDPHRSPCCNWILRIRTRAGGPRPSQCIGSLVGGLRCAQVPMRWPRRTGPGAITPTPALIPSPLSRPASGERRAAPRSVPPAATPRAPFAASSAGHRSLRSYEAARLNQHTKSAIHLVDTTAVMNPASITGTSGPDQAAPRSAGVVGPARFRVVRPSSGGIHPLPSRGIRRSAARRDAHSARVELRRFAASSDSAGST